MHVSVLFAYMYICATRAPNVYRRQKRMPGALELELQMVVSHHMSAWNQTQVLCQGS